LGKSGTAVVQRKFFTVLLVWVDDNQTRLQQKRDSKSRLFFSRKFELRLIASGHAVALEGRMLRHGNSLFSKKKKTTTDVSVKSYNRAT